MQSVRQFGLLVVLSLAQLGPVAHAEFKPGADWRDTAGNPIQAHGGGVLVLSNAFYWYGEDRAPDSPDAVSCYVSTNLYDWRRVGGALARAALPRPEGRRTFVERPKVIFNPRTGKFVMWMHLEQPGYHYAHAGVAVADNPAGPFRFLKAFRPVTSDFGFQETDPNRQKQLGGTFRDMNLFGDTDGAAYVFYASEDNHTMYVVRLNHEFTGPEAPMVEGKTWARILVGRMREAPAPFKHRNSYYLITSGCTGWRPNKPDYAVADNILGPWVSKGNPCLGPKADTTFDSQSTFVLPVPGKPGCFIFMADRWNPRNLADSRYVWLPFIIGNDGAVTLQWYESWDLSVFDQPRNSSEN